MNKPRTITAIVIIAPVVIFAIIYTISAQFRSTDQIPPPKAPNLTQNMKEQIQLPQPKTTSETSVEEALENRRSIRSYTEESLTLEEISQLLWAAQGVTDPDGKRAAPSAGATYPLEVYIVVERADEIPSGIYRYDPDGHTLKALKEGEFNSPLRNASLGQSAVEQAAANIVFTAVYERTAGRYGEMAERYVHMEAGHAAQNIYLQCESLNLGTVVIGAFHESEIKNLLQLPAEEVPLYVIPIGKL